MSHKSSCGSETTQQTSNKVLGLRGKNKKSLGLQNFSLSTNLFYVFFKLCV